jgi:hypothetical protein
MPPKKNKKKEEVPEVIKQEPIITYTTKVYSMEKINLQGKTYYRDTCFAILDEDLKIKGVYRVNNNVYKYILFK